MYGSYFFGIETRIKDRGKMKEIYAKTKKYTNIHRIKMDCPNCDNEEERYECEDGLLHRKTCIWAPGACPNCQRRAGVEYEDGLEHHKYCRLAPGACVRCGRKEGVEYEDRMRHARYCGYEKYEKALKGAKKHKKTMKMLSKKGKKRNEKN